MVECNVQYVVPYLTLCIWPFDGSPSLIKMMKMMMVMVWIESQPLWRWRHERCYSPTTARGSEQLSHLCLIVWFTGVLKSGPTATRRTKAGKSSWNLHSNSFFGDPDDCSGFGAIWRWSLRCVFYFMAGREVFFFYFCCCHRNIIITVIQNTKYVRSNVLLWF